MRRPERKFARINGVILGLAGAFALLAGPTPAKRVDIGSAGIADVVSGLETGDYVWAPKLAPKGPLLLVVNLSTQRALLFRNGIPIAASTTSTGRPGYGTPTGIFTILQKRVEHYSSTYDNAPMPYMQRLTWKGIALHAGHLPGRPASHGCIRLPREFARLLYGVTSVGMTVVIVDSKTDPLIAPVAGQAFPESPVVAAYWTPQRSADGPLSIVVSAADGRALVLRNGKLIGSAPVTVGGKVAGTWAYSLNSVDSSGQNWTRLQLDGDSPEPAPVPASEWQRFSAPAWFRTAVAEVVAPGTTVVVTAGPIRTDAGESQANDRRFRRMRKRCFVAVRRDQAAIRSRETA